jgi:3-hydroxymyristoyl/3-hydroxydecanoyl-(acyl carrier protein) dehydratase
VDVVSSRSKIAKVAAKALVDGQVAVEAELTCAIVDAAEVKNP